MTAQLQGDGDSKFQVSVVHAGELPPNKADLGVFLSNYDCVVLANVPAEDLSTDQMEMIRSNTYDQGCGLVMIGGPDAFGPGGYQGTPVEAALPVDCEIKALKAAGRGGLVLIMHASEMADGNKWQKDIAKLAIDRLNPVDFVGLMQYDFGVGAGVKFAVTSHVFLRTEFRDYLTMFPKEVLTPAPGTKYGKFLHDFVPMVGISFEY